MVQESILGSISLTDDSPSTLGGQMPDSVRLRFRESHRNAVDGSLSNAVTDFDELLLELVGSIVNSKMTIMQATALLLSVNFFDCPQVTKALVDAIWFWETQVRSDRILAFIAPD